MANNNSNNISDYLSTLLCSECGLCEMYSCHQGLSPRTLIKKMKDALRKNGIGNSKSEGPEKVHIMRQYRMVPMERLISRLGLNKYLSEANLTDGELKPDCVIIPLNQNIGLRPFPVIKKDDIVRKGQLIAEIPQGILGANLHASIDGVISEVSQEGIRIKRTSRIQVGDYVG